MSHYRGECSCKCGILDSYQIALLCMRVKISSLCDSSHRWFSLKLISSLLFPFLILIFERSAEYSEFFAMGRDRLVIPGGVLDAAPTIEERPKRKMPIPMAMVPVKHHRHCRHHRVIHLLKVCFKLSRTPKKIGPPRTRKWSQQRPTSST